MTPLRVLLVEDSATDARLILHSLQQAKMDPEIARVEDEASMRSALANNVWDVIISDWTLPKFSAYRALDVVRELKLDVPFIVASGSIGEEAVIDAMHAGAHDYVLKDNLLRLAPAIEREVREHSLRQELRLQEARFGALIEKSAEAIVVSTLDGSWTYASVASEKIFGAPRSELIGRSLLDFTHHEDKAALRAALHDVDDADEKTSVVQFRVVRPDGSTRWVEATSTNRLTQLTVCGIVTNVRDITESKTGAEALRVSEARFARLAESGVVGIFTADMEGKILDANEAYLRMVGFTREDFLSGRTTWRQLVPPDQNEATSRFQEQLVTKGAATGWETVALTKDGRRVPILVGAAMLDSVHCIAFAADLSEKKRAEEVLQVTEEHLRQAQKMEAVGRLAGGVAHDFNNVLSVVLSYSDLMLGALAEGEMRDDVTEIATAAKRAARLTRQLLMFSRRHVIDPQALDLNDLLTGMDKMLRRLVGEDVDFVSLREKTIGMINADASSIEQVIMNLVVNARDAMPTGGSITIETANVTLVQDDVRAKPGARPGAYVMLAVTDTGTGMDESVLTHIFEPFFTTKTQDKGTGLGLSTVFGIIEQSGGTIAVESTVGKGTTFRLYFPCAEGARANPRSLGGMPAVRGTETILLVEDEEQVRRVAHEILERAGYTVIATSNAGEALLACEQHADAIDLMVSDVVMPRMSGPELAKRLSVLRPDMKVLLMSGYTDDSVVRHGVRNSDIAFLQKPLTPASLTQRVREVLDHKLSI